MTIDESTERIWKVMRQDYNSRTFRVEEERGPLTREEAEALAAVYEARGHHQDYWVERIGQKALKSQS